MFITVANYFDGNHEKVMCGGIDNFHKPSIDPRPHYGGGWALRWPVHNWLIEHGISYELHWMRSQKLSGTVVGSMPQEGIWEIEVDPEVMTDDLLVLFRLKFL